MILAYVCPSRQHMLPPPEQLFGMAYHHTIAASSWLQLSSSSSYLPVADRCLSHFPGCRHSLAVAGRGHWQCVAHCGTIGRARWDSERQIFPASHTPQTHAVLQRPVLFYCCSVRLSNPCEL